MLGYGQALPRRLSRGIGDLQEKGLIVIGCGTGRCGTKSLASLLNGCTGVRCTHEKYPVLPWECDDKMFLDRIRGLTKRSAVGDVSFSYLPYLDQLLRQSLKVRVVCIERDPRQVVESYMVKTEGRNHWMNHDGTRWAKDDYWDRAYPKYDETEKEKALRRYIKDYRKSIRRIARVHYGCVLIADVEWLNSHEGQERIFDFLEIPKQDRVYPAECRENVLLGLS